MELPKNITQIGESDRNCKIYVEDYVVSYIKQINQLALNKAMAVALFGVRKTEGNVTYLFIYGSAKLDFLHREVRHLSQAQGQEIEHLRRKYFGEHEFLGYCLLNGEMVEGFHVCEQDICRYITGYAQFYEKNDSMLAYMLDTRAEEPGPEVVDVGKYDMVKQRQEERRADWNQENNRGGEYRAMLRGESPEEMQEKQPIKREERNAAASGAPMVSRSMKGMRVATVAVFGLLCLVALSTLGEGKSMEDLQEVARQAVDSLTEQKIPDAEEVMNSNVQSNTLVTEDKLTEVLQQENAANMNTVESVVPTAAPTVEPTTVQTLQATSTPAATLQATSTPVATPQATSTPVATPQATSTPVPTPTPTPAPVSYTIQEGDTLIGICINTYGSDARVSEICSLNGIADPDDIKIGQKILLP